MNYLKEEEKEEEEEEEEEEEDKVQYIKVKKSNLFQVLIQHNFSIALLLTLHKKPTI